MNLKYFKCMLKKASSKDNNFICNLSFYELIYYIICIPFLILFCFVFRLIEFLIFLIYIVGILTYLVYNSKSILIRRITKKLIFLNQNGSLEAFIEKDILRSIEIRNACIHELIHRKIYFLFKIKSHCFLDFYFDSIFLKPENKLLFFSPIKFLNFDAYCEDIEKKGFCNKIVVILSRIPQSMFDIIVGTPLISHILYTLKDILKINEYPKRNVVCKFEF